MEDTEIIMLLEKRTESALSEITRQYGRLLKHLAQQILPTAQDAEECINDAMLDLWNTIPPKHPVSISSYAAMLVRRRAVDRIRYLTAKKRGGNVYLVALEELEECIPGNNTFDEDTNVLKDALNDFLAGLSDEDRLIFMGRYFALASIASLAKDNGVTKNTINIRLSRMRKKLKGCLEERGIFV